MTDQLTDEERQWKQEIEDEDAGRIQQTPFEAPPYVPLPTAPGDVVAEIVPNRPKKTP